MAITVKHLLNFAKLGLNNPSGNTALIIMSEQHNDQVVNVL